MLNNHIVGQKSLKPKTQAYHIILDQEKEHILPVR